MHGEDLANISLHSLARHNMSLAKTTTYYKIEKMYRYIYKACRGRAGSFHVLSNIFIKKLQISKASYCDINTVVIIRLPIPITSLK